MNPGSIFALCELIVLAVVPTLAACESWLRDSVLMVRDFLPLGGQKS